MIKRYTNLNYYYVCVCVCVYKRFTKNLKEKYSFFTTFKDGGQFQYNHLSYQTQGNISLRFSRNSEAMLQNF